MGPSTRVSGNRVTKQHSIRNYAKVTKAQTVKASKNVSAKKLQALSNIVNEEKPRPAPAQLKRKRCDEDEAGTIDDSRCYQNQEIGLFSGSPNATQIDKEKTPLSKRARRNTPTIIPEAIEDLREIFKYFVRAFSIHNAHNGTGTPAGLDTLLATITRLHKKRTISREDIQRMLALFEVPVQSVLPNRTLLLHKDSPFKLVISGVGAHARYMIEYCSEIRFDEKFLANDYADAIETTCISGRSKKDCFIHGPINQYPLLAYEKGVQTAVRQEKASAVRDHVLGRQQKTQDTSNTEPDFNKLSITDHTSSDEHVQTSPSTKSRTLSLFDRVKAKQSAASLNSAPTSSELLRRHAIGRIGDVVEILRMKQSQRTSLGYSGGGARATTSFNKISFSMSQALALIKSSLTVPMATEEVRLCVEMLAKEVPGTWLKIVEVGSFQSVIIQGLAMGGDEVRALLQSRV